MHILVLNWRDLRHPLAGGAELSLFEHAAYWSKKGAKITWISSQYPNGKSKELDGKIQIIRVGSQYTVHLRAYSYFKKNLKEDVDIIVDCFHGIPYFSPLYFPRRRIVALINEPAKEVWFKNMIWPLSLIAYYVEPYFFTIYKNIPFITSAKSIARELEAFGISKKDISIVSHGITIPSMGKTIKEKDPTFLYLSQLSKDKGIEDAIQAFYILQKKRSDTKFWVAGKSVTKEYEKFIKSKIKSLGLSSKVTFFGFVSEKQKFELMSKAWVLIHPSIREGWGLNVIEANGCGTPAIGYNVTGLRDSIQHKKTGLLTTQNNPENLAETMRNLLADRKNYQIYSKNAITWAKSFHWDVAGEKSWKLLKRVYENK